MRFHMQKLTGDADVRFAIVDTTGPFAAYLPTAKGGQIIDSCMTREEAQTQRRRLNRANEIAPDLNGPNLCDAAFTLLAGS